MAYVMTVDGDMHVQGKVTCNGIVLPADSVGDAAIPTGANVQAAKLEQRPKITYSQESATTAVAETRVIHVVHGATGTLRAFRAGSVVANIGGATITVDLKKNGSSILTLPITLDNTKTARQIVTAAIASAGLVVNDVLEISIAVSAGGGTIGKGVFAEVVLDEKPQ